MNLGTMRGKAMRVKEAGTSLASGKMDEAISSLNDALPKLQALGLSVKDLRVGASVPPAVSLKLSGAIEAIDVDRIQTIVDDNADEKMLVAFLKALQNASHFKDRLTCVDFKGVEADVSLGLPPTITVGFLQ